MMSATPLEFPAIRGSGGGPFEGHADGLPLVIFTFFYFIFFPVSFPDMFVISMDDVCDPIRNPSYSLGLYTI